VTAAALLDRLAALGVRVTADGDRLRLSAAAPPPPDLLAEARAAKADLLAALRTGPPLCPPMLRSPETESAGEKERARRPRRSPLPHAPPMPPYAPAGGAGRTAERDSEPEPAIPTIPPSSSGSPPEDGERGTPGSHPYSHSLSPLPPCEGGKASGVIGVIGVAGSGATAEPALFPPRSRSVASEASGSIGVIGVIGGADHAWAERASNAEHDGGLPRQDTEALAGALLREPYQISLDADGIPDGPCSACHGCSFWRVSMTAFAPWHCSTCTPRPAAAWTDACSLPEVSGRDRQ
jgi:hypothetical protein